ncbi:unnamed protein product [Kluyveromyces dobzhanskii CBS 2104]|uniref:WGS project CCBQ000000000 data, contig 00058 n=1 Tax=Kluyveromyces dobzhanskii CBS 2104 TaxID=1427455 RepID=A0A0A8LD84_9SACH|nr:unnamed protein product [Kluyveromyces dobzhanskii CBS 2104]
MKRSSRLRSRAEAHAETDAAVKVDMGAQDGGSGVNGEYEVEAQSKVDADVVNGGAGSDYEGVKWEDHVDRTILNQLGKVPPIALDFVPFQELIQSWCYQYSVMWFSNVCSGYWTQGFTTGKPWWTEITFDERLMLLDYQSGWSLESDSLDLVQYEGSAAAAGAAAAADHDDEGSLPNMFKSILLRLIRSLEQDKTVSLKHWDEIVKYHIFHSKLNKTLLWYTEDVNCKFADLTVLKQFEIIFHMIKLIERKNIGFRNYLQNHLDSFQFPEIWENDATSLVVLPTGKIIRKQVSIKPESNGLTIPIKLQNCVLVEETENTVDVIHLDYSDEIDTYMNDVKIEYETLAHDYRSFVEYLRTIDDVDFQEFFQGLIEYHAEAEVYGRKLYANRIKQQSMQALMVRRKRSSRIVARDEGHHKKETETKWFDKLDRREQFLRHRNRILTRRTKKLKEYLWSLLWEKYDTDCRQEKMKRRNNDDTLDMDSEQFIQEIDAHVLQFGRNFKQWIVPVDEDAYSYRDVDTLELPAEVCITQQDLEDLAKFDIPTNKYQIDTQDWYLDCKSGKHGVNDFKKVKDQKIVCCEKSHIWELWEEQDPSVVAILSHGHDHMLTPRELGGVTMYDENLRRRSSRRDESISGKTSYIENRPTERKPFDVTEPFISARSLHEMEAELRNTFESEVKLIRASERKKAEEKEKRRRIKEEKKRQLVLTKSPPATAAPSANGEQILLKPQPAPGKHSNRPNDISE